jgi:hypothetical protein
MDYLIIKDYQEGCGLEDISKKYKLGKLKVKNILSSNNITIRNKGGQSQYKHTYTEFNIPTPKDSYVVAVCKQTGKNFKDYNNKSGALTNHLKSLNIPTLKSHEGVSFFKKNGFHWFTTFFNFETIKKEDPITCKICDKNFKSNLGGSLTHHIINEHNENLTTYLDKYPEEQKYFKKQDSGEKIRCLLCGEKMKIITNTHMKHKHNMTVFDYKLKFPMAKIVTNELHEKYKKKIKLFNEVSIKSFTSKGENEIKDFFTDLGLIVKTKNKKLFRGMEIDLFLPEHNIAIEYNGVRYHTENFGKKDSKYHLNKTLSVFEYNQTKLIHIFEDEWELSKNIVKAKLKHLIGKNDSEKIYARKCDIKIIDGKLCNKFLTENHIQGSVKASFYFGLYYSERLVSVMTFTKKENGVYELSRFVSDINLVVIGGASKLLKFFIKNYKPIEIISFADRRYTIDPNDNMYIKLNFTYVDAIKPDYRYFNSSFHRYKRHHKFGFRKQILLRKYPNVLNEDMSEKQMTEKLGFDRIWDCGLYKYSFKVN